MRPDAIVFGGTFDPVHLGHLAVAEQVLQQTGAPHIWFVPARVPPLRPKAQATLQARLALLRAAAHDHPEFEVLDTERRRLGASYTAATVAQLHAQRPGVELAILLGADAARSIGRWRASGELLASERFVIVNRSGAPAFDVADALSAGYDPARTVILAITSPPISASEVRRRVAAGERLDGLVCPSVAALIAELGLYRARPAVHNASG